MNGKTRYLLGLAAIAAAYYGTAKLGLELAYENSSVTAVWPPTGLALAALLIGGYRMWPGVALGALLANTWTGIPPETVLGITTGNTLEALAGAWLLRRLELRLELDRVRDVLALAGAAIVSTVVSATVGVASLRLGDSLAYEDIASVWRTWWLGDLTGDLIVAPAILVAYTALRARRRPERPAEAALVLGILAAVTVVAVLPESPMAYLVFPPLVWAALRLRQLGAAIGGLVVAAIAVVVTADGSGSFAYGTQDESLLLSQGFVAVAALTALILAAVTSERERAERATALARHRQALEFNDEVVQGLAVAKYALEGGAQDMSRSAVENTLRRAQTLTDDLLEDPAHSPERAGLRRSSPAGAREE